LSSRWLLPRFHTTLLKDNILSNISASVTELGGAVHSDLVDRLVAVVDNGESLAVSEMIEVSKFASDGSQRRASVDLILNAMLFRFKTEGDRPQLDQLIYLAELLSVTNPDFRSLINYRYLIDELTSVGYFNAKDVSITIWEFFNIKFKPFLSVNKIENYNEKITVLLEFLRYIDSSNFKSHDDDGDDGDGVIIDTTNLRIFQKLLYPILVNMIRDSILVSDVEFATEFLKIYETHYLSSTVTNSVPLYSKVPSEDYHSFLYSILESPDAEILKILTSERFIKGIDISESERSKLLMLLSRYGLVEEFLRVLNTSIIDVNVIDTALITELFFKDLGIHDTMALLNHIITISETSRSSLSYKDFPFITRFLKDEITNQSIARKNFTPRDPSALARNPSLSIQRIDISNQLESHRAIIESRELAHETRQLFVNCLVDAIASVTNTTGLIHLYQGAPVELLNDETYEILIHGFTRGAFSSHFLRVYEIWTFADIKGLINLKSFELLAEFGLKGVGFGSDEVVGTYGDDFMRKIICDYFQRYDTLSDKLIYLFIQKHFALQGPSRGNETRTTEDSFKDIILDMDPDFSYFEINNHFKSNTPASVTIPSISNTINFNKYDIKESKSLERFHSKHIGVVD
jgi:hypothetical protein